MEFNLRKSRKLESKIKTHISQLVDNISTKTSIRVNEDLAKIDELANEARTEFFNEFDNLNNLVEARQEIRNLIANTNHEVGINKLISDKVLLEAKLAKVNIFLGFGTFDKQSVEDSLEYFKKGLENGERYARTNAQVDFLTKVDEDKFNKDKQQLIKDIENLEDKLAELNYSSLIKLSANTVKLLQDNLLL